MEKIELGLNNFELPINCQKDSEYYDTLKNKLNEYLNHIDLKLNDTEKNIKLNQKETINVLKNNINLILESINKYYNADFTSAKNNIMKILKQYKENNYFLISDINKSYAFRGFVPLSNLQLSNSNISKTIDDNDYPLSFFKARDSDYNLEFKDMLHIPLDLRGRASTNRFSMPGIPCIYLAVTSYCCWLELNMPSKYNFYVSSFKIPTNIKVLNLCISQRLINGLSCYDNEEQLNLLKHMITIWPLICATSFTISEKNRNFKSEYIISQLIMQCALEMEIDSIAYLSKKISDKYSYPQCINLAIPVKKDKSIAGKYWEHSFKTQITDPILFSDFINGKSKDKNFESKNYINNTYEKKSFHEKITVLEQVLPYSDSKFSQFDDYLVNQKHNNLNLE